MIRDCLTEEYETLRGVALAAFDQYRDHYNEWESFRERVARWPGAAPIGRIFVAEEERKIVGGVAFIPPGEWVDGPFPGDWGVIRMLVVEPSERGRGIGRALTDACLNEARRTGVTTVGLHTSPIMEAALAMYLRMGFGKERDLDPIFGVPYGLYRLEVGATSSPPPSP